MKPDAHRLKIFPLNKEVLALLLGVADMKIFHAPRNARPYLPRDLYCCPLAMKAKAHAAIDHPLDHLNKVIAIE